MWDDLAPSASLTDAYRPFRGRANFERKWSIAELFLSDAATANLCAWLQRQSPQQVRQWVLEPRFEYFDGTHATTNQMLGALLLCAGAERCREFSNEDSVWPTIRKLIAPSPDLFLYNGQPSAPTRDAIENAVRALNLRNAMDIGDTQRWFMTVKLQYGFTYKGARNRLAEWLVNLGTPQAVQYLTYGSDGFECATFNSMWSTLKQFRQGRIDETAARAALASNPWIRPHWLGDLLLEARARIETLGRGDGVVDTQPKAVEEEGASPVAAIWLDWSDRQPPRLVLSLDKETVSEQLGDFSELGRIDFVVDGERANYWTRANDQDWNGSLEFPIKNAPVPHLPKSLLVKSRTHETLKAWDFADFGLAEDVMFFDMDHKRSVCAFIERLNPNTHYVLLCDTGCEIKDGTAVQIFQPPNAQKKLLRLAVPIPETFTVQFGDFVLCQPVRAQVSRLAVVPITLATLDNEVFELGAATKLDVLEAPPKADFAELLIHNKSYSLERTPNSWRTTQSITLTPQLCSGVRRVRARFRVEGNWCTFKPDLRLRVAGVAIEDRNDALKVVPRGDEINRSSEPVSLRVWPPDPEGSTLWEANCKLRSVRGFKVRLSDLAGHGGHLCAVHGEIESSYGIRCVDRGRLQGVQPGFLGQPAVLQFSQDTDAQDFGSDGTGADGFAVWTWAVAENGRARFERLPQNALQGRATKRHWPMNLPPSPLAVALAWKGDWLGAWWDLGGLLGYLATRQPDKETFATLKWLRVPLFMPELDDVLTQKVRQAPCDFLRAWRLNEGLRSQLRSSHERLGPGSIERYYLWTKFPENAHTAALQLIAGWQANAAGNTDDIAKLSKLVDVSLDLMWAGLKQVLSNNRSSIRPLLIGFICARLGLDVKMDSLEPWPPKAVAARIGDRLHFHRQRVSEIAGIDPDSVHDLASRWISAARGRTELSDMDTSILRRCAESSGLRNYFACRICAEWLNAADMGISL